MITIGVFLLGLLVFTVVGLPIVLSAPAAIRHRIWLVTPVFGIAVLVLLLHLTIPFVGVGVVVLPIALLLAIAVVAAIVWRRRHLGAGLTPAAWIAPAIVTAAASALALLPSVLRGDGRVVQASGNNDAFYFVAVDEWLSKHSASMMPMIGESPSTGIDSPAFGPAASTLEQSLRFGQELVQAWFGGVTGLPAIVTFGSLVALWLALVIPAAWWFTGELRMPHRVRIAAIVVIASSASLLVLTSRQNAAAILGVPLALATTAAFLGAMRPRDGAANNGIRDSVRLPFWLPALLLGATIGTYSEYIPILGLVLAAITLRARTGIVRSIGRAALVFALSVVIAPYAWYRAVRALLFFGGVAADDTTVLTPWGVVRGIIGALDVLLDEAPGGLRFVVLAGAVVLVAIAALGVVGALRRGDGVLRALTIAVAGGGTVFSAALAIGGNEYMFRRSVDLLLPFLIVLVVAGLGLVLAAWSAERAKRVLPRVVLAIWVGVNVVSFLVPAMLPLWDRRSVDDDFAEASGWVHDLPGAGGSGGSSVSVVTAELFDQLWISEALRDLPDVAYPDLRGDLGYRGELTLESFWDGAPTRYALVGRGIPMDVDGAAVVAGNSRFTLLDLDAGDYAIASPFPPNSSWQASIVGDGTLGTEGDFNLLVVAGATDPLTVTLDGALGHLVLNRDADGAWTSSEGREISTQPAGDDAQLVSVSTALADEEHPLELDGIERG